MTIKQTLLAIVAAATIGLSGCAGAQAPSQSTSQSLSQSSDPVVEQVEDSPDGRDRFFDYLDENDIQVLSFGEMHVIGSEIEQTVHRLGIPITLEIFTNDYLEELADRGYNVIISEHFFQESLTDLDTFYTGQPIREGSALDSNFDFIPADVEARTFLHCARELGVRIYPGGYNQEDIEKISLIEELRQFVHLDPEVQATITSLDHELFVAPAEHTYHHASNILQANPNARIVTYGGMLHNNTTPRREAMVIIGQEDSITFETSFADEFQRDLQQSGGEYREVDIVQRDLVDLVVQEAQRQRGPWGSTIQRYLFEYIMLTRQANSPGPRLRVIPEQDRLILVYGRQRQD